MSSDMLTALAAPFPPAAISWRVGSMTKDKSKARALAYLDARDVMRRLDDVCGGAGWQCEYTPMPNGTTCCRIGLWSPENKEWVWKANGAGATDIEGEKGGYSDAFKRAAVLWGVGRYLYDIDSPWVKIDEWKQIDKSEMGRLQALLPGGEPRKSANASRDDWKALAASLQECSSVEHVQAFLDANSEAINRMPAGWQGKWSELVSTAMDNVRARAA